MINLYHIFSSSQQLFWPPSTNLESLMCPWVSHIKTCSDSDICYMDFVNKSLVTVEAGPFMMVFNLNHFTNVKSPEKNLWLIPTLNTVSAIFHGGNSPEDGSLSLPGFGSCSSLSRTFSAFPFM